MHANLIFRACLAILALALAGDAAAVAFSFSTGNIDGRMGMASRPAGTSTEVLAADDFVLASTTTLRSVTFTGIVPANASLARVVVEFYRVFPLDSVNPPSGHVPTRANSPGDVAYVSRDSAASTVSFSSSVLSASTTFANSVVNGINRVPNQTTAGEGAVTGQLIQLTATLNPPVMLAPGHYFLAPKVGLAAAGTFLWGSSPRPIVAPGTSFTPDLQAWIRGTNVTPDWLRVGTDIVGGATPPQFNASFSLAGDLTEVLNVDASSQTRYDALTDGLVVLRYMFGLTGSPLTSQAIGGTATRTDPTVIKQYLDSLRPVLDIDGDGNVDALSDGVMIVRYLFGERGGTLVDGTIATGATRTTSTAIESYIASLMP